jgi:hypothetical protein
VVVVVMLLDGTGVMYKVTRLATRRFCTEFLTVWRFLRETLSLRKPPKTEKLNHKFTKGVGIKGDWFRWPLGEIPYVIQPTLPNQNRVYDAIRHWEQNTSIRFILRTDSNAKHYTNYVSFVQYTPQSGENQE